ncbi:MAG: hypothetical protein ACE5HP_13095 [Gemmatimonadota bacterium]
MPALQQLRVDELGHLWAQHFRAPWEKTPRWSVFDPLGRWLGEVETPAGFRIFAIGSDWVLGVTRDELDVEYVRLLPLVRGNDWRIGGP